MRRACWAYLRGPAWVLFFAICGRSVGAAEPPAPVCASIEGAVLQVRNLGVPLGDEQLSLSGWLADGANFSAAFDAGRGVKLTVQDLGSGIGEAVFNLTASGAPLPRRRDAECAAGMDSHTTRRGRTVRVYRHREAATNDDCPVQTGGGAALLRVVQSTDGEGVRFRLRTSSTSLERPIGPLRGAITIGMGSGDSACATYTFGSDECVADAGTLTCHSKVGTPVSSDCRVTGCSGQVCADRDVVTDCEFLPHYACYRNAECERQSDGSCGWTPTEDLLRCIAEARHVGPTPTPRPDPDDRWFACENDHDCVVYPGIDCCGCDFGGGPEVAINKSFRAAVDAYRQCGDVLCPGEFLCRDGLSARCDGGVCALH
jgi:eight-cysteine-cluster-containing protein